MDPREIMAGQQQKAFEKKRFHLPYYANESKKESKNFMNYTEELTSEEVRALQERNFAELARENKLRRERIE